MAPSASGASTVRLEIPEQLARHSDLIVSAGAVLIIGMLVIPLPHWMLDALLVVNVGLALAVLLLTAYATHPLQFSVFPSLLLIMTLFRLAINVSATRLILLHASAGAVIAAFGSFVVGGNYVVGLVVFLILVVIQFVVITNGAGRVAEVAARFTLDAMPGKQMAIDADLNAGLIDEETARRRRDEVRREADFYGAMDGASKFVRGDAIAAIVMIVVNIVGGFVIGLAQRGMDLPTALRTYTLLTIGEGLVTQIPALVMATATGLIVTRSSSGSPLGRDLTAQLLGSTRAVGLVAVTLAALALVPGLPKLPFLAVAAGVGLLAGALRGRDARPAPPAAGRPAAPAADDAAGLLSVDPIELEIGLDLIPLADPARGGDVLERITVLRRRIAEELGLLIPPVRVHDNLTLRGSQYAIKLSGARVAQGEVRPGHVLVMDPKGGLPAIAGFDTTDPAFGAPARWVPESRRAEAEMLGCTAVDASTVLLTHLGEVLKTHAAEILTLQDVSRMLDHLRERAPAVVEEVVPKVMSLTEVHRVLAELLRERVPIRDLGRILTCLAANAPSTKDPEILVERVRQALARTIAARYVEDDGTLWICALDPGADSELVSRATGAAASATAAASGAATDGPVQVEWMDALARAATRQFERMAALGHSPVVVCSPEARRLMSALLARRAPTAAVLSWAEIAGEARVKSVGVVSVD